MSHLAGEGQSEDGRLGFDRRVRVEFRGSRISSDGGLLLYRELDDVLGLHKLMGEYLVDSRTDPPPLKWSTLMYHSRRRTTRCRRSDTSLKRL